MGSAVVQRGTDTGRPTVKLPYLPALDGLRGIALIAILLTHGGVEQVRGGHLALTAFFTLSGFLITALLLVERHRTGTVDLKVFWARRARRLVPALLLTFPLVAVVVLLSESPPAESLALDAVAAATWVANWRFVLTEQSYADLFALPSPFQHFWSLAVEEQFYLVFPLLLLAVLGRGSARARTGRLAVLLGVLVVLSTLQLARLHAEDGPLGRAYYGTDVRLAEILVGSLLALAVVGPRGLRPMPRQVRAAVSAGGVAGLAGLGYLVLTLGKGDAFAYRGGFLLASLCTAAVVASCLVTGSPVARLLSLRLLVWLGLVSYGVYLFHWPLFLLLTERYTGLDTLPLLALRIGSVLLLAWLSLVLLERPVRTGDLPALPALGSWATGTTAGVVLVVAAAATITLAPSPVLVQDASASVDVPVVAAPPVDDAEPLPPPGPTAAPVVPPTDQPSSTPSTAVVAPQAPPPPAPSAAPPPEPPTDAPPPQLTKDPEDVPVPELPPPAPSKLRVAVVGDSISDNFAIGLRAWAAGRDDVSVLGLSIGGCQTTRGGEGRFAPDQPTYKINPECAWWADPRSERSVRFDEFDPELVVVEAGIAEAFDRRLETWEDWRSPGHPQFDGFLADEYRLAVQRWAAGGATILLGNAPCADWDRYEPFRGMSSPELRVQAVNLAFQRVPGVQHLDLFSRLCPNGRYSDDVEGIEDARYDGFHLTDQASEALARNWLGPIVLQAAGRG